jgi:hypothetical protein
VKLPNSDQAVVPDAKLVGYLLSASHPQGRDKARFFTHHGFRADEPDVLRRALLEVASAADVEVTVFAYGTKYVGEGDVVAPNGRTLRLRTVWVISDDGQPPAFVTAYPV